MGWQVSLLVRATDAHWFSTRLKALAAVVKQRAASPINESVGLPSPVKVRSLFLP
jgi:hypothetical protein